MVIFLIIYRWNFGNRREGFLGNSREKQSREFQISLLHTTTDCEYGHATQ